ncbi:MAG TPA: S53 family serine peptidase [Verrucomicrobiae bacterium]
MNVKSVFSLTKTLFAIFTVAAVSVGTAYPASKQQLTGHVPGIIAKLKPSGLVSRDVRLNLAIGLTLHNQDALNALIRDLSDPSSPRYRQYLTPEQFTEQFAPTAEEYQAVVDFAQTSGFTVTATHDDRMLIEVSAAVPDIENAFNLSMNRYQHPSEARTFFAPDKEPSIPSNLRIADVSGLNNYSIPHAKIAKRRVLGPVANHPARQASGPSAKNTSQEGSSELGSFLGSDYRAVYVPGVTNTGTGQIVGILEFDGYFPSDIESYEAQANITTPPALANVLVAGFNGTPGSGNSEVALDIEMVMSMAPGLSQIVSFETSTNSTGNVLLAAMVTNTQIKQFGCSWDFGSTTVRSTMDSYFQKMATQGQTFFDASGDAGAYTGMITQPDDDPNITIVGGTTLTTSSPGGAWLGEVSWNAPDLGSASSGGISKTYALPTWQTGVKTNSNGASTASRNIPDVSICGDNVFIVADNGQAEISGGTSASVQLWAGLMALLNQQSVAKGFGTIGFFNPVIYPVYKSADYLSSFVDITQGNNTNGTVGFFTTADYDLVTGIGSPVGGSLIMALTSPDSLVITPARGFTAIGGSGGPFNTPGQTIVLTNTNSASLNWSLGGVPTWVTVSPTSGTLAASKGTNVVFSLNSLANAAAAGVYTANIWFTNLTSGQAQLRQVTLQVGQDLVHDGGFECGDFAYWTLGGLDAPIFNFVDSGYFTDYTPNSGNFFAALGETNGTSTPSSLTQALPTVPGQLYQISYAFQNPSGFTPNIFGVNWITATSTNSITLSSDLPQSGWTTRQFNVTATASTSYLQFLTYDEVDYLTLDDISVLPVSTSIPVPVLQIARASGSTVTLTWNSTSGLVYQVQSSPTLAHPTWANVGSPITATGNTTSVTETIAVVQQYYRVVAQLP